MRGVMPRGYNGPFGPSPGSMGNADLVSAVSLANRRAEEASQVAAETIRKLHSRINKMQMPHYTKPRGYS